MSNIRVDLTTTIFDGAEVSFKSPADCSVVTGLRVYYPDASSAIQSQDFIFADAHGEDVSNLDELFGESAIVKVLLDTVHSRAFVQNADTNSYLERRFDEIAYSPATQSADGLMSASDKKKLDGVASGAEVNQNAFSNIVVGSTTVAADSKTDTLNLAAGSNVTISADPTNDKITISAANTTYSGATQSADGLLSASDKKKLDGIATGANAYSHPSTSGNKHIPSGGSSGQILRWSADGTAAWGSDNNTTYSAATTSADGLMSAADKTKLNGIATGANAYTHPTTSGNKHIPSGGSSGQILRWSADGTAAWGADNNTTYGAATTSANGLMTAAMVTKLNGIAAGANAYSLPTAGTNALGGVKTTSTVTSNSGYTACPIISGVPYYKDTNTTYSLSSFGVTATAAQLNYCSGVTSNIQTQLNGIKTTAQNAETDAAGVRTWLESIFENTEQALNSVKEPGMYYVSNDTSDSNYPVGVNGHLLVISNEARTRVRQVFFRSGTLNTNDYQWYSRQNINGSWSNWVPLSGTSTLWSGTLTKGTASLGNIYQSSGGWIVVAQVGANKRMTSVYIPRAFLTTDTDKWCFSLSGDDYYFTFYIYYTGTTLTIATNTSDNFSNNAIKYVYNVS